LRLQIRGKIDDVDCIEWAFLRTNTASYAKSLGDEGDLGLGGYFDTQLARADNWTGLFAFLSAFLGLALVRVDNCNTGKLVGHGVWVDLLAVRFSRFSEQKGWWGRVRLRARARWTWV
jgi:hypothetical protein